MKNQLAIAIDIGGTSIKCGFVDAEGKIHHRFSIPFEKEVPQEEMLLRLIQAIKAEINAQGLAENDFLGIGVGCPGAIDAEAGICEFAGNLNWRKVQIGKAFQKAFSLPFRIANDANAAMLGEARFGVGKEYQNLILLTLGTGVGGGIYLNGHLYEGNKSQGAELGYMIIKKDGRPCTSGLYGTLETYASATALIKETQQAMKEHPESLLWKLVDGDIDQVDGKTAFVAAKEKDSTAMKVIDEYEEDLAVGLLNYCNIFRPDAIILGGGISKQGENLTKPLEEKLAKWNYGFPGAPKVRILVSILGNDAGMLGAAALAFEKRN